MNNRDELNTAQLAEQLGAAIAHRCLNGILSADSQAHGHVVLTSALQALCALPKVNFSHTAAGFATVLVNVLETGLEAITNE